MGMTKIDGFAGEAEILGGLYRVEFSGGTLAIKGLDLDGSYAVLDALASKTITAVRVQPGDRPAPKEPAPSPKLAPPAFVGERESDRAARAALDAAMKQEKSATPPAPKEAEPPPVPAGSPPPPNGTGGGDAIPDKVAGSKRFIEVLEWVIRERGVSSKDVDGIVSQLEAIKDRVPVVQRVRDLRDKVVSNLAAWAENGA